MNEKSYLAFQQVFEIVSLTCLRKAKSLQIDETYNFTDITGQTVLLNTGRGVRYIERHDII